MDKQRENGIYKFQAFEPGQIQMLDSYCLNAFEKETESLMQRTELLLNEVLAAKSLTTYIGSKENLSDAKE